MLEGKDKVLVALEAIKIRVPNNDGGRDGSSNEIEQLHRYE